MAEERSELGPLVRSRSGDTSQIFHGSRLGIDAQAGLFGLAVGLAATVADTLGVPAVGQGLLVGLMFASSYLPGGVRSWRQQRRFEAVPSAQRLAGIPAGQLVRLHGVAEKEGEPFLAPGTWRRVVYARTLHTLASGSGRPSTGAREDVRGVPFQLRLPDGTSVRLPPADIRLLDPPRPLKHVSRSIRRALGAPLRGYLFQDSAPALLQATLAPGDHIEVVGRLAAVVSALGQSAPARGVPLVHTLAPVDDESIWVRRSAAASRG